MTYITEAGGLAISLSGFPYRRENIRKNFRGMLAEIQSAAPKRDDIDIRLLCMHHIVEGAKVGAFDYTFRDGPEVIRGEDIPGNFDLVLSGHIHRFQILTTNLYGKQRGEDLYSW